MTYFKKCFLLFSTSVCAILFALTNVVSAETLMLTEKGAMLPSVPIDSTNVDVEMKINLNGDAPVENFVSAHTASGSRFQRTNLGYWIPWNGRLEELINNHSTIQNGHFIIKVFKDQNMSQELFPIRLTISYRTPTTFKFGVLELTQVGIQ